jgi:hypothetical protein
MKNLIFLIISLFISIISAAQFAPQAGQIGSDAIHRDSTIIKAWAKTCSVQRGWMNIADTTLGKASSGLPSNAIGRSGLSGTVSLGDGGSAILSFNHPIINGVGPDFAVFENAFDPFLELAFVEVSSDGENYFRFPSVSLTDTTTQVESFGGLDATKIHNLAGKYILFHGVPFDLEEMINIPGLDVNNVTHVKIIDVVGNISDEFASRDSEGNKINDPWPTPFETGGFDLEAIAVIHQNENIVLNYFENKREDEFNIYPNPFQNQISISNLKNEFFEIQIFDFVGKLYYSEKINTQNNINIIELSALDRGLYFVKLIDAKGEVIGTKKLIKTR